MFTTGFLIQNENTRGVERMLTNRIQPNSSSASVENMSLCFGVHGLEAYALIVQRARQSSGAPSIPPKSGDIGYYRQLVRSFDQRKVTKDRRLTDLRQADNASGPRKIRPRVPRFFSSGRRSVLVSVDSRKKTAPCKIARCG